MLRELSLVGQALSDPTRLRILKLLAVRDLCVCELVYLLQASQSRVSQNLAILKYAGLVTDERHGRRVSYSLNRAAFQHAMAALNALATESELGNVPEMAAEAARLASLPPNPFATCSSDEATVDDLAGAKAMQQRATPVPA